MKSILTNAFSIQMLSSSTQVQNVSFARTTKENIPKNIVSAIGHQDTAVVLSNMLDFPVACNRANVTLDKDTVLYVAQLTGGRLPEGSTTLPEGFKFTFWKVVLN